MMKPGTCDPFTAVNLHYGPTCRIQRRGSAICGEKTHHSLRMGVILLLNRLGKCRTHVDHVIVSWNKTMIIDSRTGKVWIHYTFKEHQNKGKELEHNYLDNQPEKHWAWRLIMSHNLVNSWHNTKRNNVMSLTMTTIWMWIPSLKSFFEECSD
jgi:hypothetical protein